MSIGMTRSVDARLALPESEVNAPDLIESRPLPWKPEVAVRVAEKVWPEPIKSVSVPPTTVMSSIVKLPELGKSMLNEIEDRGLLPPRIALDEVMVTVGFERSMM